MANVEHVNILKQGVKIWNHWRQNNPEIKPDLSKGTFKSLDLLVANLSNVNMSGANLSEADLCGANLNKAILVGTNLSSAFFVKANLNNAIAKWANFQEADLTGADLSNALLIGADFTGAILRDAILSRTNLSKAIINEAELVGANLKEANLSEASLQASVLLKTNLESANLTGCRVYGTAAWNLYLNESIQKDLIITPNNEPTITVDNLEVAQFIYLLLKNEKIRDVINTITTKVVLILGRFTPERKAILNAIRTELRERDMIPILFDFDVPATRDVHETVTTLARMARYVIADITEPKSIPQELVSIVEQLPSLPIKPILQHGFEPWGMYSHIKRYPWVLAIHRYKDIDDLLAALQEKVIAPAEAKAQELNQVV